MQNLLQYYPKILSTPLSDTIYTKTHQTFSEFLEVLDPTDRYIFTPLEKTEAYERQLLRFGIVLSGSDCSTVGSFFQDENSKLLFPEYIMRVIRKAMIDIDLPSDIYASSSYALKGSSTYVGASIRSAPSKVHPNKDNVPCMAISAHEQETPLKHSTRVLLTEFETLSQIPLSLFEVMLSQIAREFSKDELKAAFNMFVSGDSQNLPTFKSQLSSHRNLWAGQITPFFERLRPFELNTIFAHTDTIVKLMQIEDLEKYMKDINVNTNNMMPSGIILGMDKRFALHRVQSKDVQLDIESLLLGSFSEISITHQFSFFKIFNSASSILLFN